MEVQQIMLSGIERIVNDQRLSKSHVSLIMALVYLWGKQNFQGDVLVSCNELKPMAKISTSASYYILMNELARYGYINYKPSFYHRKASQIGLSMDMVTGR
ncbi:hypothetical protein [Chitinophaga sp. Ak27]|uniref:hypothetical protein n=1 Tax=Chitinophaga sp. Ak27 TaxID=2726116 RepID=UPI00145F9EAD|nr:hypothetical protein [Chitinophaga sp. Ak27]NLU94838.1 hypothetical protein [Chitinophaga sp. Ak27]